MRDLYSGGAPDVDEVIALAIPGLQARAAEKGREALRERDLQEALELATGTAHATGALDLELAPRVGLELKWAQSGDTLCNCAWDIAKLGTAVAEGRLDAGYLVAGAPDAHWNAGAPGTELLESAAYPGLAIVERYEGWWRFWCRDVVTQPVRLPAGIGVTGGTRVRAVLGGTPFSIRVAEVRARPDEWVDFVCPHVARGEPCRER